MEVMLVTRQQWSFASLATSNDDTATAASTPPRHSSRGRDDNPSLLSASMMPSLHNEGQRVWPQLSLVPVPYPTLRTSSAPSVRDTRTKTCQALISVSNNEWQVVPCLARGSEHLGSYGRVSVRGLAGLATNWIVVRLRRAACSLNPTALNHSTKASSKFCRHRGR